MFRSNPRRSQLQLGHRQRWTVAAEEPGSFRSPSLLPGDLDAQWQLFSGTPQSLSLRPPQFVPHVTLTMLALCTRADGSFATADSQTTRWVVQHA